MLVTSPPPRPPLSPLLSSRHGKHRAVHAAAKTDAPHASSARARARARPAPKASGWGPSAPAARSHRRRTGAFLSFCTAQAPQLSTRTHLSCTLFQKLAQSAVACRPSQRRWHTMLCIDSFVSRRRCRSGQAKCRKCKSTKACKTCASGFKVGPKGSCVVIPKPPPYKCAAEGLVALSPCLTPCVSYNTSPQKTSNTAWPILKFCW